MAFLRTPAFHFVVIGVALFAVERAATPPPPAPARPTVVVTAARLAALSADARRVDAAPDDAVMLQRAIDEEILYREALARGLDRDDQSIRWQMSEKMRFLTDDGREGPDAPRGIDPALYRQAVKLGLDQDDPLVRGLLVEKMRLLLKRTPSDAALDDRELQAYLDAHAASFVQPARVSVTVVTLSRAARGGALEGDATRLLARLRAETPTPADAVRRGDAFPQGARLRAQSAQDLARVFGPDFAAAVLPLPVGTWVGPLPSPYGLHLVLVEERQAPRTPELADVRARVRGRLLEERQEARVAAEMQTLRARYDVRVEASPGAPG
jgi:hypothetical protein